jgi:hypothetical protein
LVPISITYFAVGERELLFQYGRPILLLVAMSAALWTFVYIDLSRPDLAAATGRLLDSSAPFGLLVRAVAGTSIIVLALGSVPDGGDLALARSIGLGTSGATLYAGSRASISLVQQSFGRSLVALRAHGVIGTGRLGWLFRLPLLLQVTWTSCLHLLVGRAQLKWEKNGFLRPESAAFARRIDVSRRHNAYCFSCACAVMLLTIGGQAWR